MEQEKNEISYAQAVRELEQIIRIMQSDDCDIDKLADYARRSLQLLKICKQKLQRTDEELQKIMQELG